MKFGSFGDINFELAKTPRRISERRSFRYVFHQITQGYPRAEFQGEGERNIQLEILLHKRFTDPSETYDAFIKIAQEGRAESLTIGTEYLGEFCIREISRDWEVTDIKGNPVVIKLSLKLTEVREPK